MHHKGVEDMGYIKQETALMTREKMADIKAQEQGMTAKEKRQQRKKECTV
jgi:hypothetical protein